MTNKTIPQLDGLSNFASDDLLHIIDVSAADPKDRKITISDLTANEAHIGLVELATTAEAQAGTDTARAVTPAGVAAYLQQPITIGVSGVTEGDVTLASQRTEDWHLYIDEVTYYTHPNTLLYLGYNRTSTGTYDNSGIQSIGIAFENDYYATAVDHYSEWYIEYRAGDGTTKRPFQSSVYINDNTIRNFITGMVDFYRSADTRQNIQIDENGTIALWYENALVKQTNDSQFLRQKNAAGTGYESIYLNSADQWIIGTITMYGDIWFNHSTNHGPILIDRATAALRRIICTNGVITTEAI